MEKQIKELMCQVDQLLSVLRISQDGEVILGSPDDPIINIFTENIGNSEQCPDNLFTENIINNNYSFKGVNLDDATASLTPSFDSFPKDWLIANTPVSMCRTYHYTLNTPNWIRWFVENGISVMVGITLADYSAELVKFSAEYISLDQNLKELYDIYIIAIGVGNEQPADQSDNMVKGMKFAKALVDSASLPSNAKITTVLKESPEWIVLTFPPVDAQFTLNFLLLRNKSNLEVVCFNMYDGYANPQLPLDVRLSWMSDPPDNEFSVTLNGFGAVRFAMARAGYDIPFWVTEFGWESVPGQPGASIPNLKTYYNNFLNFNMKDFYPQRSQHAVASPDRLFFFTIRDTNNETFGLYTDNQELDPKF